MATVMNKVLPDLSKLEPLDETNYKWWSHKLLIFFEQLEIDYVLVKDLPSTPITPASGVITPSHPDSAKQKEKHEKDDKTVKGHLLNHMLSHLFDLYAN